MGEGIVSEFKRKHVVIDGDAPKFAVASAGEKRTVHIIHKKTGDEYTTNTRTEWYGEWRKKQGGLLAELNSKLSYDKQMLPDDFDYTDIQTPEPLANVLHSAKVYMQALINKCGAESYSVLVGKGDSWRVEASTLQKYKGQRASGMARPVLMDDVVDYFVRKFGAELVYDLEVDDRICIDTYGKPGHFAACLEKDAYSTSMYFLDTTKPELGIQNGNQFGELHLNSKGEVKGIGRMHLLWQTCANDTSDNYSANVFSDVRWGAKAAYNALKDCKNDKELFQAAMNVFKHLYPEKKVVEGWRGNQIEIDALYVFQECFTLARMLRKAEGDTVNLIDVFEKLGVDYG